MNIKIHIKDKPGMFTMYRFDETHFYIKDKTGYITKFPKSRFKSFAGGAWDTAPDWLKKKFSQQTLKALPNIGKEDRTYIQKKFDQMFMNDDTNGIEDLLNSLY